MVSDLLSQGKTVKEKLIREILQLAFQRESLMKFARLARKVAFFKRFASVANLFF